MSKHPKQLDGLTRLKLEKSKLSTYCTYQEKLIGLKLEYLRVNYPQILGETLLPYDSTKNVQVSSLLDSVNDVIGKLFPGIFQGKFFPGMLLKLLQVVMINLVSKTK